MFHELFPHRGIYPDDADGTLVLYLKDYRSDWQWKLILATYQFQVQLDGKLVDRPRGVVWYDTKTVAKRGAGFLEALAYQSLEPKWGI